MKVEIRIREDNERGLFATEYIKKGEFVCILPIDFFQLDKKWYVMDKRYLHNKIDFRYGILCEMNKTEINEFQTFISMLTNKKWKCVLMTLKQQSKLEIICVSNSEEMIGNFIGHMINDYVDMTFLNEKNYEIVSKEFSNVKASSKLEIFDKRIGIKITATKDIEKGKELYLSYGSDDWKKYSNKDKFIYQVDLSVII